MTEMISYVSCICQIEKKLISHCQLYIVPIVKTIKKIQKIDVNLNEIQLTVILQLYTEKKNLLNQKNWWSRMTVCELHVLSIKHHT